MTEPAKPRKRPCASCPYRKNAPSGVWSEDEYDKLPRYDGDIPEQESQRLFMCHQQDGCLCSGWLGHRDPNELLAIRIALVQGRVDGDALEYTTDVPLFASGAHAREHGLRDIAAPGERAQETIEKIEHLSHLSE